MIKKQIYQFVEMMSVLLMIYISILDSTLHFRVKSIANNESFHKIRLVLLVSNINSLT